MTEFGFEDDTQVVPRPEPPPLAPGQSFPAGYKFTQDELNVLGECNRESFFQRSLPLGSAMGMTTYLSIQKGYLKSNPKFGVFPKVTFAVVMGYFIGKLSYQGACAEKLMALPGSYIGQLLRERKEGKIHGAGMQKQPPTMFGAGPNDIYSDAGPGSSLNLDTDRPIFNDDPYRPTDGSSGSSLPDEKPPSSSGLTYDELRRRNRGEFHEHNKDPYKVDTSKSSTKPPPPPPGISPVKQTTTKYGDVME